MHEAMFWTALADGGVRCELCRLHCRIDEGQRGHCQVRENIAGVLYTLNYGLAVANNIDPIEKKPLFHVYPGSKSYSVAAMGCNFHCLHCQNASISQVNPQINDIVGSRLMPEKIVAQAVAAGCKSIAYTYTEPTVFYEYAYATAQLAHAAGLANIFVTNGYIAPEPLRQLAPILTAANVDLKGFNPDFYRKVCGAKLEQVMQSLLLYRELGIWLEVTTLIIPGYNDSSEELVKLAGFIVDKLGADTPWHVSAFYPTYKLLDAPPTSPETLQRAQQIGFDAGLNHVYVGNLRSGAGEDTFCPACHAVLIERRRFAVTSNKIRHGLCPVCGAQIAGVGLD